jgi:N-formylglutamate deformylase
MLKDEKPFIINKAQSSQTSAVVFDSPHSGRTLPLHFKYSCEEDKLLDFGDLHVEKLLADIPATGVPVLESLIHRACVDLNRHRFEIDPNDVRGGWDKPHSLSHYTKSGMGVIPRRLGRPHDNPLTPIFNEAAKPDAREVNYRFDHYHRPYYAALDKLLKTARKEHGFYVHVDMHSFLRRPEECSDDIIIGDLCGRACGTDIKDFVADHFRDAGFTVDFNGLFQGGALVQHTTSPKVGHHAIQIEVARDLYLADNGRDYDEPKAKKLQDALTSLAIALDQFTRDPAHATDLRAGSPKIAAQLSRKAASIGPKPPV